jgi:septum formation protein
MGGTFGPMLLVRLPLSLASASPRRKELLGRIMDSFEVVASDVDEAALTVEDPWETARALARAKARAVYERREMSLVIGADTVVAVPAGFSSPLRQARGPGGRGDFEQLGKPRDEADAIRMLETLSGRRHAVITAVALLWPGGEHAFDDTTWVTFRELTREEIEAYVATGEPIDKAGAYAIQGGAKAFVRELEGAESTVIGLPLERLEEELLRVGLAER